MALEHAAVGQGYFQRQGLESARCPAGVLKAVKVLDWLVAKQFVRLAATARVWQSQMGSEALVPVAGILALQAMVWREEQPCRP